MNETSCSKCLDLEQRYKESALDCQRILAQLKSKEAKIIEINAQNLAASKQQEKFQVKFQYMLSNLFVLKENDTQAAMLQADFTMFIVFIQALFDEGQTIKLDENMNFILGKLVDKLKSFPETDFNNNNMSHSKSPTSSLIVADAVHKTNQKLLEKEISMLKSKLRQTQMELDAFKLKLKWNSSTQTYESFSSPSPYLDSFFGSHATTSPTITSISNNTSSSVSVSSLLSSSETGMGTSGSGTSDSANLNSDIGNKKMVEFLKNMITDALKTKIKHQNEMIRDIVKKISFEGNSFEFSSTFLTKGPFFVRLCSKLRFSDN